ncbi:unnamed protein product [Prorocentrum cordatum]|uniref:Polynucleotide adenylyltransferase n=1 Tax=Prorocentrum cordatum TaxID=2364126 RepID=A0ABN9RY43_9DINO|nr:unnamed protein product [Polarella glacialis]
MAKRGGTPGRSSLGGAPPAKVAKAAAPAGASTPGPKGSRPEKPSAPAAQIPRQVPPGAPAVVEAPPLPELPVGAGAANCSEEKTQTLMRAVVAYNRYHVRRVPRGDSRWFTGWLDRPVHERQPIAIRRPDSEHDLLTYFSPWKRAEAIISFNGTGTYKGGGNVFWLDPFVGSSGKMRPVAGGPPLYPACLDAAEQHALGRILQKGLARGAASAAHEARIKFSHVFTTFSWDLGSYDADHFDSSLPLVCGHVALWGFHIALLQALGRGDAASVAVLVQASLCAPIEGVIVESEERLSMLSMATCDGARKTHAYLKNSFPAFARKLMVALGDCPPEGAAARLAFCAQEGIRYNGTAAHRSMLCAAQNCRERLDDRALRTLRYIESRRGSRKSDLTSNFTTLNRILQFCATEVRKGNAAMWGAVTAADLADHVVDYIAWALDHDLVEGDGVTASWLAGSDRVEAKDRRHAGAMRMALAKIYVRVFIHSLAQDLPDSSGAKQDCLRVLPHFSGYAVFGGTCGAAAAGAPPPAADEGGEETGTAGQRGLEDDDPLAKMKTHTAGGAAQLLQFFFDLFSQRFDESLREFLAADARVHQPVCQVKWEEWSQADFVEIRKALGLRRIAVPACEGSGAPAASTRGLRRSLSAAGDDGPDDEDVNDREKEIAQERAEAWNQAQALRSKRLTPSFMKADRMSKDNLDKWWETQTAALQFQGGPGKSHRVFVLSGERWTYETGAAPWAEEPPSPDTLRVVLEWLLDRQDPCDALLVFDGRSSSIRATMQEVMRKARNVSDIWIVYQPKREAGGRRVVFGSRNREVGWVSFPAPRADVPAQERKAARSAGNEWGSTTFSSTFSSMAPTAWGQLPCIALADKAKIIGARAPVPPSKVFDSDLGCPLCWQEVKSKDLWSALLLATKADFVVDLGVGGGIAARSCLALGAPWVGLCWNQVRAPWLNNVPDRWTLEEIVCQRPPLHEQDLAKLARAHFSDVLQQLQDREAAEHEEGEGRR